MDPNERMDADRESREKCCIAYSELCEWLGKQGCAGCYIRTLKNDQMKEKALENWRTTLFYLPQNIDDLHATDKCVMCKSDPPEDADGYVTFEMAHPEPYAEKGIIFGLGKKVRLPVGSLLSFQASVGKKCRKTYRRLEFFRFGFTILFLVLGILLLIIPAIGEQLSNMFLLMPYIFMALMGIAGYFLGKTTAEAYRKKMDAEVIMDMREIPLVRDLLDRGWFFFQSTSGEPRLFFSKTKKYDHLKPQNRLEDSETESTADEIEQDSDDDILDNMNI